MIMRTPFSSYMRVPTFNRCSMTTLEHAPHSVRRKGYAPHYVPANLAKFQPEMHEPMLELVNVNFYFRQLVGPANVCCRTLPTLAARRRLNALPSSEILWSTFLFLRLMVIVSMLSRNGRLITRTLCRQLSVTSPNVASWYVD